MIVRFFKRGRTFIFLSAMFFALSCSQQPPAVVFQTDFGLKDGAVSAMKGVARGVDPTLDLYDLTHEIPPYNIWEAAYRLEQTAEYWPKGTVFVSVVDPGVGTERRSIVMLSASGHYFVTPDNGTLTLVAQRLGISEVRLIDEATNRRASSSGSYTFHGRDVYAYTAARLASGSIRFEEVGPRWDSGVHEIRFARPAVNGDTLIGTIPVLDVQYGNVWTNIGDSLAKRAGVEKGTMLRAMIYMNDSLVYEGDHVFANTFGEVNEGEKMAYFNSLMNLALAINLGNLASTYKIGSGPDWTIKLFRQTK
jgi:S-adenosylmethionine hydrolase